MARRLKLRKSVSSNVDYALFGAFRLRVEVVSTENMHTAIFLYQRKPLDPYTEEPVDEFMTVASLVDIDTWPVDEPDPARPYPIFRRTEVELDFPSVIQAEDAWLMLVKLVNNLIAATSALAELTSGDADEVWCGEPADAGDSTSDSASASL